MDQMLKEEVEMSAPHTTADLDSKPRDTARGAEAHAAPIHVIYPLKEHQTAAKLPPHLLRILPKTAEGSSQDRLRRTL